MQENELKEQKKYEAKREKEIQEQEHFSTQSIA